MQGKDKDRIFLNNGCTMGVRNLVLEQIPFEDSMKHMASMSNQVTTREKNEL